MGNSLYLLGGQLTVPVEIGSSLINGWVPGTFVKFVSGSLKYNSLGIVEKSNGQGHSCGMLITGPQHNNPFETLDDMWNTNKLKEGGENRADWTAIDAGISRVIDSDGLLGRNGSGLATLSVSGEGVFKSYIYETSYSGSTLVYSPGEQLFISSNGLITKVQEDTDYLSTGYGVYKRGIDDEGTYLVFGPTYY